MALSRDITFSSRIDGSRIYAVSILPEHPAAVVLLIHGYGEHHGRYGHVIDALVEANFGVFTLDHRGHGKSEGLRAYIDNFDHVLADISQLRDQIAAEQPALPLFIYGHSMGSLLALTHAARRPEGLAGVITSGCPLTSAETVSPVVIAVAKAITRVVPKVPLAETVPLSTLSRDPAVLRAFEEDPLNWHGKMRVRTGTEIDRTIHWLKDNLDKLTMPILLLHGEADAVTPVSGSRLVHERAPSADKTLITYPGLLHEIHNEPEREQVIGDIIAWLRRRVTAQASSA